MYQNSILLSEKWIVDWFCSSLSGMDTRNCMTKLVAVKTNLVKQCMPFHDYIPTLWSKTDENRIVAQK